MVGLRERLASVREGRFLRRGLTWQSALIALVLIVALMVVGSLLLRRAVEQYDVVPTVLDHRVVELDDGCAWEIEVEVGNESDRRMGLVAFELVGVPDSTRGMLGAIEPGDSLVRTYRHPLARCDTDPDDLGAEGLRVRFSPYASTIEQSATAPIP